MHASSPSGQNPPPSFVNGAAELASIADAGGNGIRLGAAGRATERPAALATGAVPAGRTTSMAPGAAAGHVARIEGVKPRTCAQKLGSFIRRKPAIT